MSIIKGKVMKCNLCRVLSALTSTTQNFFYIYFKLHVYCDLSRQLKGLNKRVSISSLTLIDLTKGKDSFRMLSAHLNEGK
jgi:hypothetical protein